VAGLLGIGGYKDGRFIVRVRGPEYPKDFVLSVVFRGKATHHLITPRDDGVMTINKKTFGDDLRTMKQVRFLPCIGIGVQCCKRRWRVRCTHPQRVRQLVLSFAYEDLPSGWPVKLIEYVTKAEEVIPLKLRHSRSQRSTAPREGRPPLARVNSTTSRDSNVAKPTESISSEDSAMAWLHPTMTNDEARGE
jgi:hypothetical protein